MGRNVTGVGAQCCAESVGGLLEIALRFQKHADVVVGGRVAWINGQGPAIGCQRGIRAMLLLVGGGQVVMGNLVVRAQGHGAAKIGDDLRGFAQGHHGDAEPPQGFPVIGCEAEDPAITIDGGLGFTGVHQRRGQVEIGVDVIGVRLHRGPVGSHRLAKPSQLAQHAAEIVVAGGIIGIAGGGPCQQIAGLLELSTGLHQHPQVVEGGCMVRRPGDDLTVEALGFRQIAGLMLGKRRVETIYRHVLVARVRVPVAAF